MKFKNAIVITGGIATGKSLVCDILKSKNFKIIDADEISHQILSQMGAEISQIFGSEFVKNGKVDRKKLGNLVFNDKSKLKILENLLHPKIKAEILKTAIELEKENKPYFVDIPLYFESKNYPEFYKVLLVFAPKNLALKRLMKRNNLTENEALVRINSQLPVEKKQNLSNFIIDNSSNLDDLNAKIEAFLQNLKGIKWKYQNIAQVEMTLW